MEARARAFAQGHVAIGPRHRIRFRATGRKHGTRSAYVTPCRCKACRAANAADARARRAMVKPAPPAVDAELAAAFAGVDADALLAELIADGEAVYAKLTPAERRLVDAFNPDIADFVEAPFRASSGP